MGKVIEETMLVMVDTKNNNNKFYHVTLQDDNTVTKRWGRVGAEGAVSTDRTGKTGYNRAIASKQKKGYKVSPITNTGVTVTTKGGNHLPEIAQKYLAKDPTDTTIQDLIQRLVASNAHQILEQSGGQIKVDEDGTVKTALGVVDLPAINEARSILTKLQGQSRNKTGLLENYLTLIPQNIGYRAGWADTFLKAENFAKQADFLQQLEDSVQFQQNTKAATNTDEDFNIEEHADLFRLRLDKISNTSSDFDRINKLFLKTRSDMHQSRNHKLVNVFAVEDRPEHVEAYEKAKAELGNEQELWHGSRAANILSILTKGFYVPPVSGGTVHVTGRMFGDGVYFSNQSTKSLNYASGFWSGERNKDNCFMLLNDVVMGNEYRPSRPGNMSEAYTGSSKYGPYNSINVKAGTASVRNHEAVIWNTPQIKITYLCEFAV